MTEGEQRGEDFMSLYLEYTSKTESPTFYHRWAALTSLAAWIGRDIHLPFGHAKVHANMYIMLVGLAGTKKSTAIKIGAKLLKTAGYAKFAAKKTRQEKFLLDLAESSGILGDDPAGLSEDDILDSNLFGTVDVESMPPAEVFVAADEINNFIGVGNMDFMSLLGELWDIDEVYDYKLKNSKSVIIPYPTVTLLGGNTFVGMNKLFPPEATEQGFFSRMLFIYSEPVGRQYTIPPEPSEELQKKLIEQLLLIKTQVKGKVTLTEDAYILLDKIYMSWGGMNDIRFDSYENRRIVHLLKLAMLLMATRLRTTIEKADILEASTILTYTEHLMPKALGEFGKGRNSDVSHKVLQALDTAMLGDSPKPLSFQQLWKHVHQDLDKRDQLIEILINLVEAEKVVRDNGDYLPKKKVRAQGVEGAVDWSLLTEAERALVSDLI